MWLTIMCQTLQYISIHQPNLQHTNPLHCPIYFWIPDLITAFLFQCDLWHNSLDFGFTSQGQLIPIKSSSLCGKLSEFDSKFLTNIYRMWPDQAARNFNFKGLWTTQGTHSIHILETSRVQELCAETTTHKAPAHSLHNFQCEYKCKANGMQDALLPFHTRWFQHYTR